MENKTMTYRDFYNAVINANISDDVTSFAMECIKKLDRRKSKETNTQLANMDIKKAILESLEPGTIYTASEIAAMGIDGITSTQKASALLGQLTDGGSVIASEVKIKGKGKVKGYSLAPMTEE